MCKNIFRLILAKLEGIQQKFKSWIEYFKISPFLDCSVIEIASGLSKPCQFPFIFKNLTFNGCTSITGKQEDTGDYIHGKLWCSTKTDGSNNHITDQGYYGDCPKLNCPNADEGMLSYFPIRSQRGFFYNQTSYPL